MPGGVPIRIKHFLHSSAVRYGDISLTFGSDISPYLTLIHVINLIHIGSLSKNRDKIPHMHALLVGILLENFAHVRILVTIFGQQTCILTQYLRSHLQGGANTER